MNATHPNLTHDFDLPFTDGVRPVTWTDRLKKGIWPKQTVVWVAALYLALFILRPWEILVPELGRIHFERWMVIGVFAWITLRRGFMVKLNQQNTAMGCLLIAVVASSVNAFDPPKSVDELVEFVGFVISFFVITKAVRTPYQLFFMVACYFVAFAAYVFKSEYEYFIHGNAAWMMGVKRLQGICATYGHPNTLAGSILCSLPFALFFIRCHKSFCQSWPKRLHWLFVRLTYLYLLCALGGVFLTRSRAMTLGLVVFAGLVALQQAGFAKKAKYMLLGVLLIATALLVGPRDIRMRMRTLIDSSIEQKEAFKGANEAAAGRWEGFLAGVDAFRQHPFLGVGLGSFLAYRISHLDGVPLNPHNLPGELLAEMGLLGTLAFAFFLLVMLRNMRKLIRIGRKIGTASGDFIYAQLGRALLDGTILLLFAGLSSHNLQKYQWYWFAAFASLAVGFAKSEYDRCVAEQREGDVMESPEFATP